MSLADFAELDKHNSWKQSFEGFAVKLPSARPSRRPFSGVCHEDLLHTAGKIRPQSKVRNDSRPGQQPPYHAQALSAQCDSLIVKLRHRPRRDETCEECRDSRRETSARHRASWTAKKASR